MSGEGQQRKKLYLYYCCPATCQALDYARSCSAPGFRADHVDTAVWEWVKSFLMDPTELANGLHAYQAKKDEENAPVQERLDVVEDLLVDNKRQLQKLLDLYLSGGFSMEILTERKNRLESAVQVLEKERSELSVHLEAGALTSEQVQSLQDFATRVARGLEAAEQDYNGRRRIIDLLNVQVTLTVEDGQKIIHARCLLGEHCLQVAHTSPHTFSGDTGHRAR